MYNIKYLLVNDAGSKSRACNSRHPNIFSSMMPVVKAVLVTLVIALSLTSDTASNSTVVTAQNSSTSWSSCVSTGPTPKYWESQNWTLPPLMLPSE